LDGSSERNGARAALSDEVYLLPPDLAVRDLSRPTLEQAIGGLLADGRTLEHWRVENWNTPAVSRTSGTE
jgi:hypothetical protein